jgi:hypothetical protein
MTLFMFEFVEVRMSIRIKSTSPIDSICLNKCKIESYLSKRRKKKRKPNLPNSLSMFT